MDLSTKYLGMELKSPLVASASPLSEKIENIKLMEDSGAAAVVLYSLFEEQIEMEQHELHHHLTYGTHSFAEALTYFPEPSDFYVGPEGYLDLIRRAKAAVDIPVIGSLNGYTIGGWTHYAKLFQEAGADAIELNLYYIPTDPDATAEQVEKGYLDVVTAVRAEVTIPVAVKLSPFFSNLAHMAKKLDEAGADGLVLFNRFYQPDIDLEHLEVKPNVLLSTPQAMRLPLRWIAILHNRINCYLAATSGIHTALDVIKMLMVGADATMMASALIRNGIPHLRTVEQDMVRWMEENEYHSVKQMQGSMSQSKGTDASAYERAQYMRGVATMPPQFKR